ncbi:MAG: DUF1840 domain-containing protein [Gammaproteobacteria bacterium]
MLVVFRTECYPEITMFGDVAGKLLAMMGHSGTIPGAVSGADIPAALEQLKSAVAAETPAQPPAEDPDIEFMERPVSIAQRAFPLIEMLEAASANRTPVMWSQG